MSGVSDGDIYLRTGPFVTHLATTLAVVRDGIDLLYDPSCLVEPEAFCDFHVAVRSPPWRGVIRPKVEFLADGVPIFTPSPVGHALPLFEWGLNRVIAENVQQYLIVHAASVERNGLALILPGEPGAGKSTLTAGLVYRGWRLLSDELTLIDVATGELRALARPISLKNDSVGIVQRFAPGVVLSRPAEKTIKGTIVLAKPPADSVRRVAEPALPAWVVFPNFQTGAALRLEARPKAECFIELAANALNYSTLGVAGFDTLVAVVTRSQCFEFIYSDLEEGVRHFTEMADAA